jgi:hypothetical protein
MLDIYTWADDTTPIVLKRFQDRLEKRTDLIKSTIGYVSLKNSNQYAEEGIGGYGLLSKYNGTTIPEQNQKRGFKKTYTPEEWVGKATIQYKYAKVDQSGEASRAGHKMADSCAITQVRAFYNLFANGWNASYVGSDSVSLFNSAHPINSETGAETFSNTGTATLSVGAITTAEAAMQRYKTFDGLDFDCDLDLVGVSPELASKARQLFGGAARNLPETAENDANPVYEMKYVVIKGLSAKQWFAADSNLLKEYAKMVEITAPMVIANKPDNPLIQEYIGYCDFIIGWSDARMIYGFNPA